MKVSKFYPMSCVIRTSKLVFLFIFVLFYNCSTDRSNYTFGEAVIKDMKRQSVYIEVKNSNTGRCFIGKNYDCYAFFSTKYGLTPSEYQRKMLISYQKYGCFVVNDDKLTNALMEVYGKLQGYDKNTILRLYFTKRGILKPNISPEMKNEIIQRLFRLHVACKQDDESGMIKIWFYRCN